MPGTIIGVGFGEATGERGDEELFSRLLVVVSVSLAGDRGAELSE